MRIAEVRDGLESRGAYDGEEREEARGEEDHPGVATQEQNIPAVNITKLIDNLKENL